MSEEDILLNFLNRLDAGETVDLSLPGNERRNESDCEGDRAAESVSGTHADAAAFREVAAALNSRRSEGNGQAAPGESGHDYVRSWAEEVGRVVPDESIRAQWVISDQTSEHRVTLGADGHRVIKQTWPGFFGQVPVIRNGRLDRRPATPEEYLERMALQIEVFGSDLRFEGVSSSDAPSMIIGQPAGQPSLVISQEFFRNLETPHMGEIRTFMEDHGFTEVPGSYFGWYRSEDRVAVVDAKPDNFSIRNGIVEALDLQIAQLTEGEANRFDVHGTRLGESWPL